MNNAQRLKLLTNSKKSVFSLKDVQALWDIKNNTTKILIKRMVDQGLVLRIGKGYYAIDKDFNTYELANLIISPSYVSFNSALFYHGVAFQKSDTIKSVSLLNYKRNLGGLNFKYHAMKKLLFFNLDGIDYKNNLSMAFPERALLDCFYFGLLPNLDNVNKINFTYLKKISIFYPKSVIKKVNKFIKNYDKNRD